MVSAATISDSVPQVTENQYKFLTCFWGSKFGNTLFVVDSKSMTIERVENEKFDFYDVWTVQFGQNIYAYKDEENGGTLTQYSDLQSGTVAKTEMRPL